jgi:hypothetical protein
MTAQLTGISSSAMPNPWPSTLFEADLASGVVAVFIRPFGVAQAPTRSTCSLNFVYHALTMPSERVQRRIDELLDQAELAIRELDWSRVRETSLSILAADAENEDAATFLAMADPHVLPSEAGTGRGAAEDGSAPLPQVLPDGHLPQGGEEGSALTESFTGGRYQVSRFLGEGGKKMVYLARDTTLYRDVAFGLIKAEGLDDEARQRIIREAQAQAQAQAQAMARLDDHPNIMPIYELGDEGGQPFMVQPLLGGGDVEALIEQSEDGKLSLEDAMRVASEILSGLEFAHSKEIIHRYLKPGNVWLTDDGVARIGDFGLAISLDRSRLTQEKMIVGTVSYMPPEQATGGEITPRADLYSLGAILYEMVTGSPPFLGDDDIAVISQHVNTPPVVPAWHNALIPKTLGSLIVLLLAKDPDDRPESAKAVLMVIASIDASASPETDETESRLLDSMAGGVFVGRNYEMDRLKAMVEDALSGTGRITTLVGEPGIGKTRTAQELATYASMRGAHVLWGRCYEERGAPPYCPWLQAIWECANDLDTTELRPNWEQARRR